MKRLSTSITHNQDVEWYQVLIVLVLAIFTVDTHAPTHISTHLYRHCREFLK